MPKKKILIVDDDTSTRMVLSAKLRSRNYETVAAADSIQAISVARQELPHLVLLDIEMPGGDGFVVAQRLKALTSLQSIPVIIMTSSVEREKAEARSVEVGAEAFLTKPVNQEELFATIEMILGE
jgi:two-component system, cell cycle response regulator